MDENKKLNILKDRKLDRQEKNKSEGLKKGKGRWRKPCGQPR